MEEHRIYTQRQMDGAIKAALSSPISCIEMNLRFIEVRLKKIFMTMWVGFSTLAIGIAIGFKWF